MYYFCQMRNMILVFTLMCLAYSNTYADKTFALKLHIKNAENQKATIGFFYGNEHYIMDTIQLNNKAKAEWLAQQELHKGMYFVQFENGKKMYFLVQDGGLTIKSDLNNLFAAVKVKGSNENKIYLEKYYKNYYKVKGKIEGLETQKNKSKTNEEKQLLQLQINTERENLWAFEEALANDNPKSFYAREYALNVAEPKFPVQDTLRWMRSNFYAQGELEHNDLVYGNAYFTSLQLYVNQIVGTDNDDTLSFYLTRLLDRIKSNSDMFQFTMTYYIKQLEYGDLALNEKTFVSLVDEFYRKGLVDWEVDLVQQVKMAKAKELSKTFVGKKAPELVLSDSSGTLHSLHDLEAKYKLVIFWDPDCSHCQKQMPLFYQVYQDFKDKGLKVYAVYTEANIHRWKDYQQQSGFKWLDVADIQSNSNFRNDYYINATPKVYLINSENVIEAKGFHPAELREMLSGLHRP